MVIGIAVRCNGCGRPMLSCVRPAYCFECDPHNRDRVEALRAERSATREQYEKRHEECEAEWRRLNDTMGQVTFPGYQFECGREGEVMWLRVVYREPDVFNGVVEEQKGRRWLVELGSTPGQIVQTAFKALLTSLEHRGREHFCYRGRPVLNPHQDLESLWNLAGLDREQDMRDRGGLFTEIKGEPT